MEGARKPSYYASYSLQKTVVFVKYKYDTSYNLGTIKKGN